MRPEGSILRWVRSIRASTLRSRKFVRPLVPPLPTTMAIDARANRSKGGEPPPAATAVHRPMTDSNTVSRGLSTLR